MKKHLLLVLITLFSFKSYALTITTGSISGSPFCGGDSVYVPYTVDIPANSGNIYTAQLSDSKGNFGSPVNIGTLSATGSGTIPAIIPLGSKSGTKYRIRVVSSLPATTGSTNTKNLKINPKPKGTDVTDATPCSVTLIWKSTGTAVSYKTRYKLSTDPNSAYTSAVNVGNVLTYTFTGLRPGLNYTLEVRAVCANGQMSSWSKQAASTLALPAPTGATVTGLSSSSATLDWDDMDCATGYRIRYKYYGDVDWIQYLTSSSSTLEITGLYPGTDYQGQIATLVNSDSGAYTGLIGWETFYFKMAGTGQASNGFTVYPNPGDGMFTLQFMGAGDNIPVKIIVADAIGKKVLALSDHFNKGLNQRTINIPNASSGLYFITVNSSQQNATSTLMVK